MRYGNEPLLFLSLLQRFTKTPGTYHIKKRFHQTIGEILVFENLKTGGDLLFLYKKDPTLETRGLNHLSDLHKLLF